MLFSGLRCLPSSVARSPWDIGHISRGVSGSVVCGGRLSEVQRESRSSWAHLLLLSHEGSAASSCLILMPTSRCLMCCLGCHPCPCSDTSHGVKLRSQLQAALARQSPWSQGLGLVKSLPLTAASRSSASCHSGCSDSWRMSTLPELPPPTLTIPKSNLLMLETFS